MQNSRQSSFLKLSSLSWTLPVSSEWAIKAYSKKKKSLRAFWFEATFVRLPAPPSPINYYIGGSGQQMKKKKRSLLFSLWLTKRKCPGWVECEPIGVYWSKPSLMNPSRTSVMLRHVKECFDFWDVCVRAGPTSNLPAVWLQYQTTPLNYSKASD